VPGDDVGRRTLKRGGMVYGVTYAAGWLVVIVCLVVTAAFDLPVEPVAASMITAYLLGAMVFAAITGRRIHADLERAKRDAERRPDGGDRP